MKARVASMRNLKTGETAGYGRQFVQKNRAGSPLLPLVMQMDCRAACQMVLDRCWFKEKKVPIVGRICMDQALVDISELEEDAVKTGDVVTLIGTDGNETLTAADMAEAAGTITNEF